MGSVGPAPCLLPPGAARTAFPRQHLFPRGCAPGTAGHPGSPPQPPWDHRSPGMSRWMSPSETHLSCPSSPFLGVNGRPWLCCHPPCLAESSLGKQGCEFYTRQSNQAGESLWLRFSSAFVSSKQAFRARLARLCKASESFAWPSVRCQLLGLQRTTVVWGGWGVT